MRSLLETCLEADLMPELQLLTPRLAPLSTFIRLAPLSAMGMALRPAQHNTDNENKKAVASAFPNVMLAHDVGHASISVFPGQGLVIPAEGGIHMPDRGAVENEQPSRQITTHPDQLDFIDLAFLIDSLCDHLRRPEIENGPTDPAFLFADAIKSVQRRVAALVQADPSFIVRVRALQMLLFLVQYVECDAVPGIFEMFELDIGGLLGECLALARGFSHEEKAQVMGMWFEHRPAGAAPKRFGAVLKDLVTSAEVLDEGDFREGVLELWACLGVLL